MFSVKELVEIAVNVEENGEKFYRKLSKKVKNDEQKKLSEYLAGQEIEYARVFRKPGYVEGKVFPSFNTLFERVKGMSFGGSQSFLCYNNEMSSYVKIYQKYRRDKE